MSGLMHTNLNLLWTTLFLEIILFALKWAHKRKLEFLEEDAKRLEKVAQEENWEVYGHE